MATRYCGRLTVRISIRSDGGLYVPPVYNVTLSANGSHVTTGDVTSHEVHNRRLATDSPEAFDLVARVGLANLAAICRDVDYYAAREGEDGDGPYVVRRTK